MPSNEDLDRLVALAETIADREAWQPFATYLALRGRGRRAEALRVLDTFLNGAENWPFAERHALLLWLAADNPASLLDNLLIPQPLWRRVVAPTASEWLAREPDNARANYLYAIHVAGAEEGAEPLAYMREAVRLDPADQAARTTSSVASWRTRKTRSTSCPGTAISGWRARAYAICGTPWRWWRGSMIPSCAPSSRPS
jgi:hypothetical protein